MSFTYEWYFSGEKSVQDLVDAHMIPESVPSSQVNETDIDFAGKTCEDVKVLKEQFEQEKMQSDARKEIMDAWGID